MPNQVANTCKGLLQYASTASLTLLAFSWTGDMHQHQDGEGDGEGDQNEYRVGNVYPIDVIVRKRSDLTELMALVWRGRRYNIRSIMPFDARREFLIIRAEGGVPL